MNVKFFSEFICIFSMIVLTVHGNILMDLLLKDPRVQHYMNSPVIGKLISTGLKTAENTIFKKHDEEKTEHLDKDFSDKQPPKKNKHFPFNGMIDQSLDKTLDTVCTLASVLIKSTHLDPVNLKGFDFTFGNEDNVHISVNNISFSGLSLFNFADTHLSYKKDGIFIDFNFIFHKLQLATNYRFEIKNYGPFGKVSLNLNNLTLYSLLKINLEKHAIEIMDLKFNDNNVDNIKSETELKFTHGSVYGDGIANLVSSNVIKALKQIFLPIFQHGLMTTLNKLLSKINILNALIEK